MLTVFCRVLRRGADRKGPLGVSRAHLAQAGLLATLGVLALVCGMREGKADTPDPATADVIKVHSKASLVHLGSLDSFDRTELGTKAAKLLLDSVENNRPESAREALKIYETIIPKENFGGEYTSLQWLCEYLVASARERKDMLTDRHVDSFYHLLADNNYAVLRQYIRRKYHLDKSANEEDREKAQQFRFQEDFMLFNNPRRERWEKSSKMIAAVGLKKGDTVADIGSGPGYFTFKFADLVGDKGKVYAVETSDEHIKYLSGLLKKFGLKNIETATSSVGGIALPKGVQVDYAFMCSLYHIIYCTFTEGERHTFLDSIKRHLKPDGTLIVIDNALVEDRTLPYHGPYIAKELIIAQLKHSGFTLTATHQFIPQRYMLVFKQSAKPEVKAEKSREKDGQIVVKSDVSLVQCLKSPRGPEFTVGARKAARDFYKALDKKDKEAARSALQQYKTLMTKEQAGNEYGAFAWYCEYMLASAEEKKEFLKDKFVVDYFQKLGGDDFTILKKYVRNRYFLDLPDREVEFVPGVMRSDLQPKEVTLEQVLTWHEFIVFNNPRRENWEKSNKILSFLKIKPGDAVADLGCGTGYYTFKFSDIVGKDGRVYAADTSDDALEFVRATSKKHGFTNIRPVKCFYNDTKLPAKSSDVVFLCSMYHAAYVTSMEFVRDQFIQSIKDSLKKGGRVVIVDNELSSDLHPAYYGPRIDRRLIIEQLRYHGFKLVDQAQFIPQRYVLVFQVD
jgi:ubiquinone/menaquinone biosynthesis C-methylase UbiE